jgi:hypothetical protein
MIMASGRSNRRDRSNALGTLELEHRAPLRHDGLCLSLGARELRRLAVPEFRQAPLRWVKEGRSRDDPTILLGLRQLVEQAIRPVSY